MRLTELGGQTRMAHTKATMKTAGNSAVVRSIQSMPQDGHVETTFGRMKWIPLALGLTAVLAYGLGWAASLGSSLGLNSEIARLASSFSGARAALSPEELGATLTPVSSAAASMVASLGATCRFGPVQAGLLWSSQSLTKGGQRNEWVAGGAEDIQAIRIMRLRLGMTF